jgi:hypothetical protein
MLNIHLKFIFDLIYYLYLGNKEDEDYEPTMSHDDEDEDEEPTDLFSLRGLNNDDSDSDFQLDEPSNVTRRTNHNGNRVRKLRSTTNRPSPPLPNQSTKRKRSVARLRVSSETDSTDSQMASTSTQRTRLRRRTTQAKRSSVDDDFDDVDDENRRRPRTTQATRVSKRGRVLKQRLLSE